jgi:hypothetical protein
MLISNSLKKYLKNLPKKSYNKKCDGYINFFHFYSCLSKFFAYNCFLVHLKQKFERI